MGVKIRKPKGRKKWGVYVDHRGMRWNKSIGTKKEAERVAKEIEAELEGGTFEVRNVPTFNRLFNEYVPNRPVKDQTKAVYITLHEKHLEKSIGTKPVDRITYEDLARLPWANLSTAHRNNIFTVISMVMKEAKRRGYITKSPTEEGARKQIAGAVDTENGNHPFETGQEVELFLKGTRKKCPEVFYYLFLTMAGCGLRVGEAVALDWNLIDFAADVVRIRYTMNWKEKTRGTPKTPTSKRNVTMPVVVANNLEIWKQGNENEIVFPNKNGERMTKPAVDQMIKKVCAALKIHPRSAKDLRSTYGTLRASANHSLQDIQKQMGHKNITTTINHYAKYLPSSHKDQSDEFGEMLLPSPTRINPHQKPETRMVKPE